MGCLEGSGVPVLYIGRTVPKGLNKFSRISLITFWTYLVYHHCYKPRNRNWFITQTSKTEPTHY